MTTRESAVAEALWNHERKSYPGLPIWERSQWASEPWQRGLRLTVLSRAAVVLAALDTTPQPALGDDEADEIAGHCFNVWADTNDRTSDSDAFDQFRAGVVPHIDRILTARAHQPTPPAQEENT